MTNKNFKKITIKDVIIDNVERVKIAEGGKLNSYHVVFQINELMPDERQKIDILVDGKLVPTVDAWSSSEGDLKMIYILDMKWE